MVHGFRPVDRDQLFLLPCDMRDWLPEDHLVWFVIGLVERLDLSELERVYRLGGQGRWAYDPAMMLSLLLWAAIEGVRSSRRIERACRQDAAFRVICGTGGEVPDHTTICWFRQDHEDAILGLFVQVLVICDQLGLLPLGGSGSRRHQGAGQRRVGRQPPVGHDSSPGGRDPGGHAGGRRGR
jgi:transposase